MCSVFSPAAKLASRVRGFHVPSHAWIIPYIAPFSQHARSSEILSNSTLKFRAKLPRLPRLSTLDPKRFSRWRKKQATPKHPPIQQTHPYPNQTTQNPCTSTQLHLLTYFACLPYRHHLPSRRGIRFQPLASFAWIGFRYCIFSDAGYVFIWNLSLPLLFERDEVFSLKKWVGSR